MIKILKTIIIVLGLALVAYGSVQKFFLNQNEVISAAVIAVGLLGMSVASARRVSEMLTNNSSSRANVFIQSGLFFINVSLIIFLISLAFYEKDIKKAYYLSLGSGMAASILFFLFSSKNPKKKDNRK